jgi:hypothetical protein
MNKHQIPYVAGVVAWIIGLMAIFGLSWPLYSPDTVATAVMWTMGYWWAAYAFGLVILVVTALLGKIPLQPSLLGFILPVAVIAAMAMVCLWIYPDLGFRAELMSYMPVTVVFYVLSVLWLTLRKHGEARGDLVRTAAPPMLGGIMILTLVAIPVFTSNAFIYRNAFKLDVLEVIHPDNSMVAKCVLEIRKPGDYDFQALTFFYFDMIDPESADEDNSPRSTVTWGETGKPAAGAIGKFPMEILWSNIPDITRRDLMAMPTKALPILIEARSTAQPQETLYTFTAEGAVFE